MLTFICIFPNFFSGPVFSNLKNHLKIHCLSALFRSSVPLTWVWIKYFAEIWTWQSEVTKGKAARSFNMSKMKLCNHLSSQKKKLCMVSCLFALFFPGVYSPIFTTKQANKNLTTECQHGKYHPDCLKIDSCKQLAMSNVWFPWQ